MKEYKDVGQGYKGLSRVLASMCWGICGSLIRIWGVVFWEIIGALIGD